MESISTNASKEERERAQKVREAARNSKPEISLSSTEAAVIDQSSKACTHFVALPENFEATETLDASVYGMQMPRSPPLLLPGYK